MKIKVDFFDKTLRKDFLAYLATVSIFFTLGSIVVNIPNEDKVIAAIILLAGIIIIYFVLWIRANLLQTMKLNINNSIVKIKVGDIFQEKELKVISFNEYFDTQVNNAIISERTLNGMYIKNILKDATELDNLIETNQYLKEKILGNNPNRKQGKQNRYKIGTILQHNEYLLTAFSKFDSDNRAYLFMNDYINFLLNFWNEIDIVYSGKSISIPLLGSGMTRFKEYSMTDQELLELLIWSFKISRIKFTYPSIVSIVIHESKKDKINFYKLKELA